MKGIPKGKRTARFVCTIALASPHQLFFVVEGYCNGFITEEPKGSGGFGYDPVFYATDYKQTFAELNASIKNKISHRAIALEQFKKHIIPPIYSK